MSLSWPGPRPDSPRRGKDRAVYRSGWLNRGKPKPLVKVLGTFLVFGSLKVFGWLGIATHSEVFRIRSSWSSQVIRASEWQDGPSQGPSLASWGRAFCLRYPLVVFILLETWVPSITCVGVLAFWQGCLFFGWDTQLQHAFQMDLT